MNDEPMAARIERAARETPGVAEVYGPGSPASKAVAAGARLVGLQPTDAPLVRATEGQDGWDIHMAIGVGRGAGAGDVVRAVSGRARGLLPEDERGRAAVQVTVVHVEGG